MRYEEILNEYLLEMKLTNYSLRTVQTYQHNNRQFINYYKEKFGKYPEVEEISKVHYKNFISYLLKKGLKSSYINTILKGNKAFWSYVVNENIVKEHPMAEIKQLKEPKTILTTFNHKEVKAMLDYWNFDNFINARNKCIIAVFLDTGIRVGELIGIRERDVSEDHIRVLGKGNKWRVVPLSENLRYFIMKYRRIRDKHFSSLRNRNGKKRVVDEYLFVNRGGRRINTYATIEIMVKETGKAVGVRKEVRCSPHTLRHYYSVTTLQNDQDIYTISKILGHESIKTTSIYLQSITNEQILKKALKTSPLDFLI